MGVVKEGALAGVLRMISRQRGVDFRDHRTENITKGIGKRLLATGTRSLAEYQHCLEHQPGEIDRLIESLVVPVSGFFRDEQVFAALEQVVLPRELGRRSAPDAHPYRVWAIGIATGEEAWSLAMLLDDGARVRPARPLQVLATDIDRHSLEVAASGCYPRRVLDDVPARFHGYFSPGPTGTVRVDPWLNRLCSFVRHDVVGPTLAPPEAIVAAFGMVVVRNVLIHFDRRLRRKALDRVCGVLKPGGVLVLGPVETLPDELASDFRPYPGVAPNLGIHVRQDDPREPRAI